MDSIKAISPIDGRYSSKTEDLQEYFSEYALFKYRTQVEVEYFIALCEMPLPQLADFDSSKFPELSARRIGTIKSNLLIDLNHL